MRVSARASFSAIAPMLESFRDCDTEEEYGAALRAAGLAAGEP